MGQEGFRYSKKVGGGRGMEEQNREKGQQYPVRSLSTGSIMNAAARPHPPNASEWKLTNLINDE